MSKLPALIGEIPDSDEVEAQPQADQGSSSDFEDTRPKSFSQEKINDLVRDLNLLKDAAELLGHRENNVVLYFT